MASLLTTKWKCTQYKHIVMLHSAIVNMKLMLTIIILQVILQQIKDSQTNTLFVFVLYMDFILLL